MGQIFIVPSLILVGFLSCTSAKSTITDGLVYGKSQTKVIHEAVSGLQNTELTDEQSGFVKLISEAANNIDRVIDSSIIPALNYVKDIPQGLSALWAKLGAIGRAIMYMVIGIIILIILVMVAESRIIPGLGGFLSWLGRHGITPSRIAKDQAELIRRVDAAIESGDIQEAKVASKSLISASKMSPIFDGAWKGKKALAIKKQVLKNE